MKKLMVAVAGAMALACSAFADTWFDTKINTYTEWPTNNAAEFKGTWSNTDSATLGTGELVVEADVDSPLTFAATDEKSPANYSVKVNSSLTFTAFEADALPVVPTSAKAGVISCGGFFYVLAKDPDGETNVWTATDIEAAEDADVAVQFIDANTVEYSIAPNGGATTTFEKTVATVDKVQNVHLSGDGAISALNATAEARVTTYTFTLTPTIAGTEVKVYTNNTVEVTAGEGGYTVLKDAEVTIVYTADQGKLFADGTDTKTLNKTISADGAIDVSGEVDTPTDAEAKIGTQYYLTLQGAVDAAAEGDKVEMVKDVTRGDTLEITKQPITLDLGGNTLTSVDSRAAIESSKDLVLTNGTVVATNGAGIDMEDGGNLAICTAHVQVSGAGVGFTLHAVTPYANFTLSADSSIKLTNSGYCAYGIYEDYTGVDGAIVINGKVEVEGEDTTAIYITSDATKTLSFGETAVVKSTSIFLDYEVGSESTISIEHGTFDGEFSWMSVSDRFISGGSFNLSPDDGDYGDYIMEGCEAVQRGDRYVVGVPAAKIGDVYYLTLQEALDVGGEITVLADLTESVTVAADKTVTLDLNGKTLQNSKAYYTIDNAGTLTIVDNAETKGTITHLTADTSSTIRNLGVLTINDITVGGTYIGIKNDEGAGCNGGKGYGELTLNGVTFNGDDQAVQNWGHAALNGGTFNGAVYTWAYAGNAGNVAGVTTIDGGTFSNKVAAVQMYDSTLGWPSSTATVTINGGTFEEKVFGSYTTDYTGDDPEKGVIFVPIDSPAQFKIDETPYVTLAEGYKFKQNLAGYYQVFAIDYATLTIDSVDNCTISVTNAEGVVQTTGATFDKDDATELYVTRTPAEGYELDGCEATETITMDEDQTVTAAVKESTGGKTVAPGGTPLQVEAESAEAATNGVTVAATSPDQSIVSDADYSAYFYAKAAETSSGHYTVYAALKPEIKAAEDETAQVAAELTDIAAGTATSVTVSDAKPGLWYSVTYTDNVANMATAAEGDRAQAGADGSVTIVTPKTAADASAQFYQVQVNTTDKGTVQ